MSTPEKQEWVNASIAERARKDAEIFLSNVSKYMPDKRVQPFHDMPVSQRKYTSQAGTETILPVLVSDIMKTLPEDQKISALFSKAKASLKFSGTDLENLYFQEFFRRLSKGYPEVKH